MKSKYERKVEGSSPIVYPVCDGLTTDQSRVTAPAWMYRDLPQVHAYILPEDPQANTEMHFRNNVSTRVLEKDNFRREIVCPSNNQDYTKPLPTNYTNSKTNSSTNSKEGFSNIFHSNMSSVGKNVNIEYAKRQFAAINNTQKRHIR